MKYAVHTHDFGLQKKPFIRKWRLYPINTKGTFKDDDGSHLRPADHSIIIDIPTGRNPNQLPSGGVDSHMDYVVYMDTICHGVVYPWKLYPIDENDIHMDERGNFVISETHRRLTISLHMG